MLQDVDLDYVAGIPTFGGPAAATVLGASGITGAVAASRYAGGTASGAPGSGTFATGDFVIDQTGDVWVCTAGGSPGTWASVRPKPAAPLGSTPTAPSSTTSATLVMMGLGTTATGTAWSLTPASSGKVLVTVTGLVTTATAVATATLGGRYAAQSGPSAGTTVAAGSNGGEISTVASWSSPSAGVLDVASVSGWAASGTAYVATSSGVAQITYTGTSAGQLTGCAYVTGSATGTVSTGGAVTPAPQNASPVVGTRFGAAGDLAARPQTAGVGVPFALTALLALTPGTAYWFDLALAETTGGGADAASVSTVSISLVETS